MNTLAPLEYSRNILYEAIGNLHSINNFPHLGNPFPEQKSTKQKPPKDFAPTEA